MTTPPRPNRGPCKKNERWHSIIRRNFGKVLHPKVDHPANIPVYQNHEERKSTTRLRNEEDLTRCLASRRKCPINVKLTYTCPKGKRLCLFHSFIETPQTRSPSSP